MQEELVSFKVAKLAKDKGFDWLVTNMFKIGAISKGVIEEDNLYDNVNKLKSSAVWSRPTQSLLQRWLREVHNIHFITKPYIESLGKKEITGYYIPTICTSSLDEYIEFDDNYSTYEEALDEGLFQALNLLPDKN